MAQRRRLIIGMLMVTQLMTILSTSAQSPPIRKRMTVVDVYDAGQPQAIILKLFDPGTDVVCYVLMPEQAARKEVGSKWVYEGNAVGSISCVPVAIK